MARRGRPQKGKERPTSQVRMYADQYEMIGWIMRIDQKSTAQILDEMIGKALRERYRLVRHLAAKIKATEDEIREALGQEPLPPLPSLPPLPA